MQSLRKRKRKDFFCGKGLLLATCRPHEPLISWFMADLSKDSGLTKEKVLREEVLSRTSWSLSRGQVSKHSIQISLYLICGIMAHLKNILCCFPFFPGHEHLLVLSILYIVPRFPYSYLSVLHISVSDRRLGKAGYILLIHHYQ